MCVFSNKYHHSFLVPAEYLQPPAVPPRRQPPVEAVPDGAVGGRSLDAQHGDAGSVPGTPRYHLRPRNVLGRYKKLRD